MAGDQHLRSGLALPAALDEVHDLLSEVGAAHPDIGATELMRLETALIELVGNIVEHGRPPGEVAYTVRVSVEPEQLIAVLTDTAHDLAPEPGEEMPETWAESGRGLPLAGAVVDELVHQPTEGAAPGNTWRLRLQREPGGG
ncbi:ATP-binding protein [Ornithinimicrobium cavernae]|uniref:ATP-binding protein n=1 Tax=Ornithinimicrobium cavernae TaxID=2666047 RepID=UPI000D68F547|nr:ATP-binding protein [Ornithinimicrobium cavernae]